MPRTIIFTAGILRGEADASFAAPMSLGAGASPTGTANGRNDMLLEGKNAVIYGGGGSIGGAVARAFAREGAPRLPRRPHPGDARGGGGGDPRRGRGGRDGRGRRARPAGRRRARRRRGRRGRQPRHLLQRDHAPLHPRHPDGRDGRRRLRRPGRDRGADDVPHHARRRPPHDAAEGGRAARLRRLGRPDARLLHRRHPGRLRGGRVDAASSCRSSSARTACAS